MKRTQVYFDEGDWARLQGRARAAGLSAAAVVREAVGEYLARTPVEEEDPILRLIRDAQELTPGLAGPTDGALNHDHYLYGWPKEGEPWPQRTEPKSS